MAVQEILRMSRDVDGLYDGDQSYMGAFGDTVEVEVFDALTIRLAEVGHTGDGAVVIGGRSWDHFQNNEALDRLRCTVQGHLTY